jgi:hypothetical protein
MENSVKAGPGARVSLQASVLGLDPDKRPIEGVGKSYSCERLYQQIEVLL